MAASTFSKESFENASMFDWQHFGDADVRRQFKLVSNIGPSALENQSKVVKVSQSEHFG